MAGEVTKAARALLGWTQRDLANHSHVNLQTIMNFENWTTVPRRATIAKLRKALEEGGVTFIPAGTYVGTGGLGVRLTAEHH